MKKDELIVRSQVIGKLLLNRDLSILDAIQALGQIQSELDEIANEEDYKQSLKDCYEN